MVVKFRSFLLSSVALAVFSHTSIASVEHDLAKNQSQALERGKAALDDGFIDSLINRNTEKINQEATSEESQLHLHEESNKPVSDRSPTNRYTILISDAMGDEALLQLFHSLEHRTDVSFVLRGLLPTEKTITSVGRRIVTLLKSEEWNNVPNVLIDPRPFRAVHAEYAPQILMYQNDELVLSATGLSNPNYLHEQFEAGKTGDLGKFGSTVKITERYIGDVIKERAKKLDKDKLIQDAKDRYWDNVTFLQLPEADSSQTRKFAPIVTVDEDIVAPDGTIVASKGDLFNTLTRVPFTHRLVIFDATDKAQMAFVKSLPETGLRTKYITTRFDRTLKWDAIKSVENELNAPVFKLNNTVVSAFDVRVIPSVVTADNDNDVFLINEYALDLNGEVQE
jgi:conjugal transfer pilus assembly protein TraW